MVEELAETTLSLLETDRALLAPAEEIGGVGGLQYRQKASVSLGPAGQRESTAIRELTLGVKNSSVSVSRPRMR